MATFAIPNRPFATEPFTGLMTPDGLFEAALGQQVINVHVKNTAGSVPNVQVYVESVSDPGIVITPATHYIGTAESGASHLFSWQADFTLASPGKHLVSFIVRTTAGNQRIIKKIFVTKMAYHPATHSFSVTTPEGVLDVAFKEMLGPKDPLCCRGNKDTTCTDGTCRGRTAVTHALNMASLLQDQSASTKDDQHGNLLRYLTHGFRGNDKDFVFCVRQVLIDKLEANVRPTPAYTGQYGDLPFQDPWWKIALAFLAFLLVVAAAIAEALDGSGDVTAGAGGTHDLPSGSGGSCCTPAASGSGTSPIAAGLLAAAGTVALIAGASDARDPFRKGQDHTAPATNTELTTGENLKLAFKYPEAIIPGTAFKVGVDYQYERQTTAQTYNHAASETNTNTHLLDHYHISAPDVVRVYKREAFIMKAQFYDGDKKPYRGDQLFVQCFLVGPAGQVRKFPLQDHGVFPDEKANDGTYTGGIRFSGNDGGLWKYFVLAQDVNRADPNLEPEEAAQIIAGMILTDQLSISFTGGTCPLVADGDVNVLI